MYSITILILLTFLRPAEVNIYGKDKHNETSKGFQGQSGQQNDSIDIVSTSV